MVRKIRYAFILCFVVTITSFAQLAKSVQFKEEVFDFGNVSEDGGPAVHEFVFTNTSGRPMKVLSVQASCGCTTPDWSKDAILPGKTGFIQASFNPKGRPGYFNKTLTVTTDLDASSIILQIKGQVTNEDVKPASAEFVAANGNWKFKTSSFNMGKVYLKDEFVVREFAFVNAGSKPVTYDKFTGPKYIRVDVQPKTMLPGAQGIVKISYNGKIKNQYGFQSDNVELQTNDELNPVKSFSVFATLEDFFPQLTPEEQSRAPRLNVGNSLDFGHVKQNTPTVREVSFTNYGKKDLIVKSVQGNCTCISASATKATVKQGESSTIKITFNPQDRKGTQTKAVMVYSNDPQNPVQRITFTAYVED